MATVGVLGGMGPAATVDFMARMLAATPATRDQDHVRLIVDSNPQVPDRNAAIAGTGPSPAPVLAAMARGLAGAGADVLAMPCNAAHAFADAIRDATPLPFVDMIAATVAATLRVVPDRGPGAGRVGVLAATGCLQAGLYQDGFAAAGLTALVPEGDVRRRFMALLYAIKAGTLDAAAAGEMRAIAQTLIDAGAQAIVAGCTEVPLLLDPGDVAVPLVNSTDALVAAVLDAVGRGPA